VPLTIDDIRELVCLQLGLTRVEAEDHLVEDLGAESADVVNIVAAVEEKYHLRIDEDEIQNVLTVKDLFALARDRAASS
jgi:acyl carrier protein